MDYKNRISKTNKFPELLSNIIDETTGAAILNEANHFQEFTDRIDELIVDYKDKSAEAIERNSLTGFLFTSYNSSIRIKESLEEFIKDLGWETYSEELKRLNQESFNLFNLDIQKDSLENGKRENFPISLPSSSKDLLQTILRKNKVNDKILECYLYYILIYNIYQDHLYKLEKLEKARNKLLISLRAKTKHIDENFLILSQNNYDLVASKSQFVYSGKEVELSKLLKEYSDVASAFSHSLKVTMQNAYKSFEKDKRKHNEILNKNGKKYTPENVKRASKKIEDNLKNARKNWKNTSSALSDDWALDLEINALKYNILKEFYSLTSFINNRLTSILNEKIKDIRTNTEELIVVFSSSENLINEDIIDKFNTLKLEFRRKLVLRLLPSIKELLFNNEILKEINEFEKRIILQFDSLSKSRIVLEESVYDQAVESSKMNKISPFNLVSYDMQPKFMLVFPSLKSAVMRHLGELQVKLEEIPEIIDFSIESAIGYFVDKSELDEALKIGEEGIHRAINKIDDLEEFRDEFRTNEIDQLKTNIDKLIEEINEITDNESALQIKVRVTKAKALEQSKAVRDSVVRKMKDFLPRVLRKSQTFYQYLKASTLKIRKQFEIEANKGYISSDVSDFLAETEEAINRLPFVYQRLFKLEPLSVFDLYIERKVPLEELNLGYTRWKNGKFAPTIIYGEKGSGKTTCLNRFLSLKTITEEIIYHDLYSENLDPDSAYKMISESVPYSFGKQDHIQLGKAKKIIVIDGLEKLFEARIGGFDAFHKTMKMISNTNHSVFWIASCHLYSYKYLEKSSNISDYFGYHIELEDLTAEELNAIIEKRHNISGFRLEYLADTQKKSGFPLIKQGDKTGFLELKSEYFDRLQKAVKGNITQAFLYWMRSAAKVTEDLISMNMPGDKNLDFVQSVSLQKLEILRNILIHNGINSIKHAEVFRIPFEKSELQLDQMFDDGLIVQRSGIYNINPMIYKQVIERLFKLNLLH